MMFIGCPNMEPRIHAIVFAQQLRLQNQSVQNMKTWTE